MELEKVLTVHVAIGETIHLRNEAGDSVVMITFGGHATGSYFEGTVLTGGVDTQVIGHFGDRHILSARYMLRGTDHAGQSCEIYIENNGENHKKPEKAPFRTTPKIITNSKALDFLNGATLVGEGRSTESGIDIHIYRVL